MEKGERIISDLEVIIWKIKLIVFDFDGVFTDNMVYTFEDGREAVRTSRSEGLGLQKLKIRSIDMMVLSTEENSVVAERCRKLGLSCIHGCYDKLATLNKIIQEKGISLDNVAYVGNDINDLPCLKAVGFPIIVQNAHSDILPYAKYQTKRSGGNGAVREICDLFDQVLDYNKVPKIN